MMSTQQPFEQGVKGFLILRCEEANGRTEGDRFVWDAAQGSAAFEAFVKVELRGGVRGPVKAISSKAPLIGDTITWRESLKLEVSEGASELRLMICRDKFQGTKKGTSVVAACGIFVDDIIEACPIDKYFELFKPNAGGEGGFIRICLDFVSDPIQMEKQGHHLTGTIVEETASQLESSGGAPPKQTTSTPTKKKGGKVALIVTPLVLLASGAAAVASFLILKSKK